MALPQALGAIKDLGYEKNFRLKLKRIFVAIYTTDAAWYGDPVE